MLRIARGAAKVREVVRAHPGSTSRVFLRGATEWQVSYYDRGGRTEIGQVLVDDASGTVLEAWTGPQVAWTMARGYPGAFGRKVNALYVWLPLLVLFVAPFVDPRRPLRLRHLDLLALCSLSVSLAFFNHGNVDASVPLAYPPLLYLLARLLWVALRRGDRASPGEREGEGLGEGEGPAPREPLALLVPPAWLAFGIVFLLGFRIALNVADSNVIDVGYAGVIGADKLLHGHALYGAFPADNPHGDTYGPVNYLTYVPFVAALGWSGHWDSLPAAHAAAIVFDLLCVAGLFVLGRRLRGPVMGLALAWGWVTFPFTLFAESSNANDALVAALLIGALLAASRPAARGALAALAALTKFAPLGLVPLLATHGSGPPSARGPLRALRPRPLARFTAGFVVAGALALVPVLVHGGLGAFADRTLGFQASRDAPFSVWGLWHLPGALQTAAQVLAGLFALVAGLLPRRRDVVGLAALAGAVLIALQLTLGYWFYLYVVWFVPLVLVAFLAVDAEPATARAPARAAARSRPRAALASSG